MSKSYIVLYTLGAVIFSGGAANYYVSGSAQIAGLTCSDDRISAYGWTHSDRARAELAAILSWKKESTKRGASFAEWHTARDRHLTCHTIGGPNGHYQCTISALPCKVTKYEAGA